MLWLPADGLTCIPTQQVPTSRPQKAVALSKEEPSKLVSASGVVQDKNKIWKELIDFDTSRPNVFMSKTVGASSFFEGFMWAAQGANMGYRWKVGNGKKVRQWEDNGLGSSSLAIQFWLLYRIVNKKNCSFAELWDGEKNWKCTFRGAVDEELFNTWLEVVQLVLTVQLTEEEDALIWQFSTSFD